MMMYDELIKRLRKWANSFCGCCKHADKKQKACDDCTAVYGSLWEAADAIEELEQENEKLRNDLGKAIRILTTNRWISITERLPEYMENVLVTDGVFSGMGWRDWYDYRGTKPREDYWIAPNANVNELNITHWMPLPQPPKEET